MKKFTLFLAALCCCAMMANATNYSLQVAGIQVTDANCSDILNDGKVSYDDATKTLTLNNASITVTSGTAIFIMAEMKIQLLGNNTITLNHSNAGYSGIYSLAKTTIYHESKNWSAASLTITTHNGNNTPIAVYGDLDILGPIDLKVYGYSSMGQIYATNLNINGASIYFDRGDKESVSGKITIEDSEFRNGVYVDAGGKFFRNSNGTKMDVQTHVWLDTMLRKLWLMVKKANMGNIAFLYGAPFKTDIKMMISYGETIELDALAAPDYQFRGWYNSANELVNDKPVYTFLKMDEVTILYADFQYIGIDSKELDGKFSIAANRYVVFAPGNLKYQGYTGLWLFENEQYDYLGEDNNLVGKDSVEWTDLVLFGAEGWSQVLNGGPHASEWFLLNEEEWNYLLFKRPKAGDLKARATIYDLPNGVVKGYILLPDNYTASWDVLNTDPSATYASNEVSLGTWKNVYEAKGAVFLPAAGTRNDGTIEYLKQRGCYWTPDVNTGMGGFLYLTDNYAPTIAFAPSKTKGCSIRPVREVAAPQGIEDPTTDSSLKGRGKKLIKDGQLLIERNGKTYNALGAEVQ